MQLNLAIRHETRQDASALQPFLLAVMPAANVQLACNKLVDIFCRSDTLLPRPTSKQALLPIKLAQ